MKALDASPLRQVLAGTPTSARALGRPLLCGFLLIALCADAASIEGGQAGKRHLFQQLLKSGVLDKDRVLVHLSRVCTLTIDRKRYPVLDVMELAPGAQVPHGVNRVVVTDVAGHPVRLIDYVNERPLFCLGPRLYLHGDLAPEGVGTEGNVLLFSQGGSVVSTERVDINALPLQASGLRTTPPE